MPLTAHVLWFWGSFVIVLIIVIVIIIVIVKIMTECYLPLLQSRDLGCGSTRSERKHVKASLTAAIWSMHDLRAQHHSQLVLAVIRF